LLLLVINDLRLIDRGVNARRLVYCLRAFLEIHLLTIFFL
jgi:hypothetical protein